MTDLPTRRFRHNELVTVLCADGTRPVGRIWAFEDGRQVVRNGKSSPGWVYYVEIEGHDTLARRRVIAEERALGALTECQVKPTA